MTVGFAVGAVVVAGTGARLRDSEGAWVVEVEVVLSEELVEDAEIEALLEAELDCDKLRMLLGKIPLRERASLGSEELLELAPDALDAADAAEAVVEGAGVGEMT